MQTYTNETGVPLSVAVYLATDLYDYVPGVISATSLLKSVRQQVLTPRVPKSLKKTEITGVVKSRLGTSIHDGLEKAWSEGRYISAMASLGYPQAVIDRIQVNPGYEIDPKSQQLVKMDNPPPLADDAIPVYMEIRSFRELDGKMISGKFDFLAEGRVEDFKSTSTFTWVNKTKTEDYQLQGSIYRWLNPKIITQDVMAIQFFFTDFMAGKAKGDPKYPQRQVEQQIIPLLSLADTEAYIRGRLQQFQEFAVADELAMPPCTDKELWRKDPVFKYYRNPEKRARSTKNFTNPSEAYDLLIKQGNVGVVVEVPGTVMACNYCSAFPICTQKDRLISDGSLIVD
tara:strand:- start:1060 stop:2085 length:1026 start_codon:yes stop_codon:yes gene_type:complete